MRTDGNDVLDEAASSSRRRRRLRRGFALAAAVGIPVLVFVLWWFQPQALFIDNVVDEGFPIGTDDEVDDGAGEPDGEDGSRPADPDPGSAEQDDEADTLAGEDDPAEGAEPAPSGPVELASGSFVSRNRYTVTGTATTYQLEDGQRILRLEDFESTNGPDLYVYLTVAGSADDDDALDDAFVDLGALTGNIGNQNYVIPDDVDLDLYTSVAIWCRRFTTSFGVADLST